MKKLYLLLILLLVFAANAFGRDYVIGGGDTLFVSVWGNPELSMETMVRPDGKISLPAVGDIVAAGLTAEGLTEVLNKELAKMVKTPIVTVIVKSFTNYKVYVLGRGTAAGVHLLSSETSLLQFLSELGALNDADLTNAVLIRQGQRIKQNFYKLYVKGDIREDIILEPDDMLFIPDNFERRISVVGAVKEPVIVPFREGLTLLDVLLSAGGFTEYASESDVTILRNKGNGERTAISVNAKKLMKGDIQENILIDPGDLMIVKESLL